MARGQLALQGHSVCSALIVLLSGCRAVSATEEESTTTVSCAISVMLLGSMGFQMVPFYLVNWPDADIRRYAWRVISQTISIFCAVLLFQAFNGMIEEYLIEGSSLFGEVVIDMAQLVVWLTLAQAVLAVSSGAVGSPSALFREPTIEKAELNCKSWSALFAHLTGFAAINAWACLQQYVFSWNPLTAFFAVPLGMVGVSCMFRGFRNIRDHISEMDDGRTDEFERLWHEEAAEAEDDVAGLSLSFVTVQAIRFLIGGSLPNPEGIEPAGVRQSHGGWQWIVLFLVGVLFLLGLIIPTIAEQVGGERLSENVKRSVEILNNYLIFGSAWCFFYCGRWALAATQVTSEQMLLGVTLAMIVSFASFALIFVLDHLEDNLAFGAEAEGTVESLITALGVLIGFSWEQCFDTAVGVAASGMKAHVAPPISKLAMSILLVIVVFPAWRMYILPTERELANESYDSATLKAALDEHREFLLSKDTDEHTLDLAHLKLKAHRRQLHGCEPEGYKWGLKHLRVTAKGVTEVHDMDENARSRKTSHHRMVTTKGLLE